MKNVISSVSVVGLCCIGSLNESLGAAFTVYGDRPGFEAATVGTTLLSQDFETFAPYTDLRGVQFLPGVFVTSPFTNLVVFPGSLIGNTLFGYDDTTRLAGIAYYDVHFASNYNAVGFNVAAWDPSAPGPAHVEVFFSDGSNALLERYQTSGSEYVPVFFGIISDTFVARVRWHETPEIYGGGNEEVALDDFVVGNRAVTNHAPSASATVSPLFICSQAETNRLIVSPNNVNAAVIFDGSQSSDADNDPLEFSWHADGQTSVLATGAIATNQFAIGPHTVTLVVTDGHDATTAQVSFEVITAAAAVGQVGQLVNESILGPKNKQPLLVSLNAAISSFDRGNFNAALNQLSAFQNKLHAQVEPLDSALAAELSQLAQNIAEAQPRQFYRVRQL